LEAYPKKESVISPYEGIFLIKEFLDQNENI